ncbi:MAG TPA: thioredoxin domain-containing protein [Candidatus Nanoarchaeia archaeon]|nr:thioredoxin domain-containing protein [Candidatus Nanoarchaeia archaeon]
MVKIAFPFVFFAIFLGVLLNGCTPTFCSTPYILSDGDCCLDKNEDEICDEQQDLSSTEREEYASPLDTTPAKNLAQQPTQLLRTNEAGVILTVDPDDDFVQGNPDAEVTLIEFGDYTNTNSQRFYKEVLPQILEKYGTKINYVFRNFPEPNNENAQLAAEASECADEQGKFLDYHQLLFQSNTLTLSTLRHLATRAELNLDAFEACFFAHRFTDEVLQDRDDGLKYGVSRTPTFFLNNQKIIGFKFFDIFDTALKDIFYKELLLEQGTSLTAQSTGLAYAILPGPAALDPTQTSSPYSNVLELVDGVFSVAAHDITRKDSATSRDTASLAVTYSSKVGIGLQRKDIYTIELKELLTEGISHSYFGGVGMNVYLYGNTGIGTRYLPRTDAYLTLWGLADIKKNDVPYLNNVFAHFVLTRGLRNHDYEILQRQDDDDIEAYLLISSTTNQTLPFPGGFLYLFWPEVNLREA